MIMRIVPLVSMVAMLAVGAGSGAHANEPIVSFVEQMRPGGGIVAVAEPAFTSSLDYENGLRAADMGESAAQKLLGSSPDCVCDCCGPRWTFSVGALLLERDNPESAVLVTNAAGAPLLNASQFDFENELGYEVSSIRHQVWGSCWDLETRYFQVDGWEADLATVNSPTGSLVPYITPIGNIALPSDVSASYRSDLWSMEVSGRRPVSDCFQLLMGFRYLELDERGLAVAQDIGPSLNLATHSVGALNRLYGFQLGGEVALRPTDRLTLEGTVKAGVYGNHAENGVVVTQTVGPTLVSSAAAGHTAFVGELRVGSVYCINSRLSVRGAYQMLWLEGVASASDQIAVSNPAAGLATVDTSGGIFYHGGFFGLQWDW